jgi:hypothetical protein
MKTEVLEYVHGDTLDFTDTFDRALLGGAVVHVLVEDLVDVNASSGISGDRLSCHVTLHPSDLIAIPDTSDVLEGWVQVTEGVERWSPTRLQLVVVPE